jgi:hypothetical protein
VQQAANGTIVVDAMQVRLDHTASHITHRVVSLVAQVDLNFVFVFAVE